jgi:hypothetical protein
MIVAAGFHRETAARDLCPSIWHPHRPADHPWRG